MQFFACSFAHRATLAVIIGSGIAFAQSLLCASNGTLAPPQTTLDQVRTAFVNVSGSPIGVIHGKEHKHTVFFTVDGPAGLGILNTSTFPPTVIRQLTLPEDPTGLAFAKKERQLIVASGQGAYVVNTDAAVKGEANAVEGFLNGTTSTQAAGDGAFGVTLSANKKFAFVTQEYGSQQIGNVDVFKLHYGKKGALSGTPVGFLSLDYLTTDTRLSHDGKTLYATSEQMASGAMNGTLSVIDVKKLEKQPSEALKFSVPVGCGAVRAIISHNKKVIWVTARYSNLLQAFEISKLKANDSSNALLASITVGTSPVGVTFARNETRIITADSNRFQIPGATSGLTVVDVEAALSGKGQASVLGRIPTGLFPREFAKSEDRKLILVSDYDSNQIQAIDETTLP